MKYTQPQSGARIDWSNPITRELVIAPNYATMHDAVGKFPVPLYARAVTNRGVGIYFDGTQTASSCRYSDAVSLEMRGAKSLLIQATVNLTAAGQIVGIWGVAGPQFQFLLRTEPDGSVMFGPYRQNSEVRIRKTAPGIAILGKTQSIVAYWSSYEDVLYVVVDGVEYVANVDVWAAGSVPLLNENATEPLVIGCEGTSASKITGTITSLQIYKDAIFTARSRAALAVNPWQIFADSKKPIFIGVGATPSGLSVAADLATASAVGHTTTVNLQVAISSTLATAAASGFTANVSTGNAVTATIATATASGHTATVNQQLNITATQAVASASGQTATVNRQLAVVATSATATASGQTATVNLQRSVAATQAVATATGYVANVHLGNDLSISATQAAATASGFDATINRQLSIAATIATATASGFDASISNGASLAASYGLASADGYQAQINLHREIAASLAVASASGSTAVISTTTGSAVWPDPADVLSGTTYGPTGADYTGTATAGGYPTAADIAAAVRVEIALELARIDAAISSRSTVAAIMGYDE